MSKAPEICLYCDGEGNSSAGGRCGFCENGKPLDTQDDWDRTWMKTFEFLHALSLTEGDEQKIHDLLYGKEEDK